MSSNDISPVNYDDLAEIAQSARRLVLEMVTRTKNSHIGSAYSIIDILTVLYFAILQDDKRGVEDRDRFILSKGHSCSALYSVLKLKNFLNDEDLDCFCRDAGVLAGHPIRNSAPGIETSTGSLGHGLSIAAGLALAAKFDGTTQRIYTLLGDGECNEGSIWEGALFCAHHHLDNLTAVIDYNKIQGFGSIDETLQLEPLGRKWEAFNWSVREIDGHDYREIHEAFLSTPFERGKPSLIIAHTIKGKGVSFMEHQLAWHYKSPDEAQYRQALKELS